MRLPQTLPAIIGAVAEFPSRLLRFGEQELRLLTPRRSRCLCDREVRVRVSLRIAMELGERGEVVGALVRIADAGCHAS